ncbi:MAG: hypothetical protein KDA60_20995, partial [Planctomycetales bacterium]|nr:hypothetical protein [Planctomycetales bacterium]
MTRAITSLLAVFLLASGLTAAESPTSQRKMLLRQRVTDPDTQQDRVHFNLQSWNMRETAIIVC